MADQQSPAATKDNDANADETSNSNSSKRLMRSYVACKRCHSHKVKCSGEPAGCRNCLQSKTPVECVYPVRDRKIAVPESYLKKLEAENKALKRKRSPEPSSYVSPPDATSAPGTLEASSGRTPFNVPEPPLEEGLRFVSDETSIQPMYIGEASCTTFGARLRQYLDGDERPPVPRRSRYYQNTKLLRISSTECQLPNRNYAQLLVRVVLRFVGADYHLLGRKSFLDRLDETYTLSTFDDPIWLCRLFTCFALGEVYSVRTHKNTKGTGVPGTAFFLKAMDMFQDLYEEPTIQYIETLLLLSFYSVVLNRRNTAYTYCGLALRLSMVLGLHRKIPQDTVLTPYEREHRIRVWWSVYCLDRITTSKFGNPVFLRDQDIDVQLPSMDGLSPAEREDFYDPMHLIAHIQLSRITGNVLGDVYRIPQPGRANTFVQGVQRILTSLRAWHESLPPLLRLNPNSSPMYASRSVASLHLHFGQCVILTTRPILFHLFRSKFYSSFKGDLGSTRPLSPMTTALAEACIQTARTSNSILAQLWVDGCLATYGFFDALSIFSSTMILMMSSTLTGNKSDEDAVETAWSLLRSMRDDGNVPASCYYDELVELKRDLDEAIERHKNRVTAKEPVAPDDGNGLQMLLAASGSFVGRSHPKEVQNPVMHSSHQAIVMHPTPYPSGDMGGAGASAGTGAALNDPFLQDFLSQQQPVWAPDTIDNNTLASEMAGSWNFDWSDANLF